MAIHSDTDASDSSGRCFAALGIFVGGTGLSLEAALSSAVNPSTVDHYPIAYLVLATTVLLDSFALVIAVRPVRRQAAGSGISLRAQVRRSTDPAAVTVVVGGACAVVGAVAAAAGLILCQLTGSAAPDTLASAFIGLMLFVASVILLRTNRGLLSGRGVPLRMLREMRLIVAAQPGVVAVADLFAVVVGPSSLIVNGDVIFADDLTVPGLEHAIMLTSAALRERWPSIDYIYLTPVPKARSRRTMRPGRASGSGRKAATEPVGPVAMGRMTGRHDDRSPRRDTPPGECADRSFLHRFADRAGDPRHESGCRDGPTHSHRGDHQRP